MERIDQLDPQSERTQYRKPRSVLSTDQALNIYSLKKGIVQGSAPSAAAVARSYGVSEKAIRDIWKGRTWSDETMELDPGRSRKERKRAGRPVGSKKSGSQSKSIDRSRASKQKSADANKVQEHDCQPKSILHSQSQSQCKCLVPAGHAHIYPHALGDHHDSATLKQSPAEIQDIQAGRPTQAPGGHKNLYHGYADGDIIGPLLPQPRSAAQAPTGRGADLHIAGVWGPAIASPSTAAGRPARGARQSDFAPSTAAGRPARGARQSEIQDIQADRPTQAPGGHKNVYRGYADGDIIDPLLPQPRAAAQAPTGRGADLHIAGIWGPASALPSTAAGRPAWGARQSDFTQPPPWPAASSSEAWGAPGTEQAHGRLPPTAAGRLCLAAAADARGDGRRGISEPASWAVSSSRSLHAQAVTAAAARAPGWPAADGRPCCPPSGRAPHAGIRPRPSPPSGSFPARDPTGGGSPQGPGAHRGSDGPPASAGGRLDWGWERGPDPSLQCAPEEEWADSDAEPDAAGLGAGCAAVGLPAFGDGRAGSDPSRRGAVGGA